MPAFTLCEPLTHVILSVIDCTMSVPVNGQRESCPKEGALLMVCPPVWALNPEGRPKFTWGRRFKTLLAWLMRGRVSALPLESFNGSRLSWYVLVPPVAVDVAVSSGLTPCRPRVTP